MSETWNEDWQKPEGSGEILGGENWQEEAKGRREEISEDLVDLVIGGLGKTYSKPRRRSKRKRKKDDIFLPEI